ncbi:GntR family transcriptional regulator [Nonomuraea sp. PA05]|uniref:GntR family transcriptional regulator n=1 Tax=Nonomuraea sp. PA05 TaxID=2604466 RepID=UPI0011DAC6A1|nr:GntR family transcriptional regulator [Nonomuraea sp. PA05]TYB71259.1 GntR family transcriptional regulator [Nonomuraea sp. PA05]
MAEKPVRRYQQVANDLREKILNGSYPVGQPLPHSRDLLRSYGLGSDNVLREAYKILKAEGLIRRNAAVGMIVQDPSPVVVDLVLHNPTGHGPLPWPECCKLAGLDGRMVTDSVTPGHANQDVAALLGIEPGTDIVTRARTAFAGDVPVRLDEAIYPRQVVEGTPIATERAVPGGIYATLAHAGHAPAVVARRTVRARLATGDEPSRLRLATGSWVLAADQVIVDECGRAVELLRIVANPARVRFTDERMAL